MEIIVVIIAVFIYTLFAPYINYIIGAMVNIVPSSILIFLTLLLSIKAILFVIHRGDEG